MVTPNLEDRICVFSPYVNNQAQTDEQTVCGSGYEGQNISSLILTMVMFWKCTVAAGHQSTSFYRFFGR